MPFYAITLGSLLVLLGLVAYMIAGGPGEASVTALIPSFLGLPILIAGLVGRDPKWRTFAVYTAAALALIGLLGTVGGLLDTFQMITGAAVERPTAAVVQAITAILCIGFLIRVVQSVVSTRENQEVSQKASDIE